MQKLKKLISYCKKNKLKIAVCESCSGGYLAYLLTSIPQSSQVFKGGIVAYSLEAKEKLLKMPASLLRKTQGVSKEVAGLLAQRTKNLFRADIALALVGFAGPTARKGIRVGTVFMALADKEGVVVKKGNFKGSRDSVRKKASLATINLLKQKLLKN